MSYENRYYVYVDYKTGVELYYERHGEFYYKYEKKKGDLANCLLYEKISINDIDKINYLITKDIEIRKIMEYNKEKKSKRKIYTKI